MSYRLTVRGRAKRSLAAIWLDAADRNTITRASHRMELRLRNDPIEAGESRTGTMRVAVFDPLVAFYTVDSTTRRVVVVDIRSRGQRPHP